MASEALLPAAILILTLAAIWAVHSLPTRSRTKNRTETRTSLQASGHLQSGSHLLSRATSSQTQTQAQSLAKAALLEAEAARSLSPRRAEPLVLKAHALHLMGRHGPALRALDLALSPPRVRSLSEADRAHALVMRAEVKVAVNVRRRVDSAVEDLLEAVGARGDDARGLCLLGECYEWKGLSDEARDAFGRALGVEPDLVSAQEGLRRLGHEKAQ